MPIPRSRHAQNGAILVQFALVSLVLLTILATVQIGYMYSSKRDLQRIADLAALEAVQGFRNTTTCIHANEAGEKSIRAQWPLDVTPQGAYTEMVKCGNWNNTDGFALGLATGGTYNAVRVTLTGESLTLVPFTGNKTVQAVATAAIPRDDPQASFSLGAGVARLQGGALNNLLTMLLGTSVNLSAADYTGLANTKIDLLGLKETLNLSAGTYNELLDTTVTIRQLLNTSIDLARKGQQDSANVAIAALEQLLVLMPIPLQNTSIHLLKDGMQKGLLDLGLHQNNPLTALQTDVSALNLLMVGLQIANKDSALTLDKTGLNLSPLANIDLQAKIIEPPVIAVGRAGMDANGNYRTTAHSGQIRVAITLKVLQAIGGLNNLLDVNLLGLARLTVGLPAGQLITLPIYAEVGSADGRLEDIMCYVQPNMHKARIGAKPGIAFVFVGHIPQAMTNTSLPLSNLPREHFSLLSLKIKATLLSLLGEGLTIVDATAGLKAMLNVPIDSTSYQSLNFDYATDTPRAEQSLMATVGSEHQLGRSISAALGSNLLDPKLDTSDVKLLGISVVPLSVILDALLSGLTGIVSKLLPSLLAILNPVFDLLDIILGPLLSALGLQIGYADVELLTVDCNPQLVD